MGGVIFEGESCLGENYSEDCWMRENCRHENSSFWNFELSEFDKCMNVTSRCYVNSTWSDEMFSFPAKIGIHILYSAIFIAAVLGNALVCYVVFISPRMRTSTNYLIANLALGDLLMAILCVPFAYIPELYQFWPFGQILCHVLFPAQTACIFVSAYTLVAMAMDRYRAILYPLSPGLRTSKAVMVILLVWIVAILTATPIGIVTSLKLDAVACTPVCTVENWSHFKLKTFHSVTLMILQYLFPLTVLLFTYSRIAVAVWGNKVPGEAEDGRDGRLAKSKRKMIKMMMTVVSVYAIVYLPINVMTVWEDVQGEIIYEWIPTLDYVYLAAHWLAMSHTVWNPIIYCWMNSRFRSGFQSTLSRVPIVRRLTWDTT